MTAACPTTPSSEVHHIIAGGEGATGRAAWSQRDGMAGVQRVKEGGRERVEERDVQDTNGLRHFIQVKRRKTFAFLWVAIKWLKWFIFDL